MNIKNCIEYMNIFNKEYLMIKACVFYVIFLFSQTIYASEFIYHLSSEQWAVPRSVDTIVTMQAVASAMQVIQLNRGSSLVIHHPGGDEGTLWATELRGWLISLGLSTSKISLIPGSSDINQLDLEIIIHADSSTDLDK